jgi:DNA modification methylase
MKFDLHHGDCLEVLRTMADNSVDSIVTDPPYGLSFMGKKWDYDVPGVDVWAECLRVLKPGGHLLAFAGTRTQHRMAVRIEDAGFEIRDMIAWVYGSGFPKSLDVSKAIDKTNGEIGRLHKFTAWMRTTGLTASQINAATGTFMGSHYLTDKSQPAIPTRALWVKLRPLCGDVPAWVDELVERIEAEREVVGMQKNLMSGWDMDGGTQYKDRNITAPATEAAKQWEGWGTALKPSLEPVTVARKPLIGTVAENVLEHGTGGLNIDGCRVGRDSDDRSRWSQTGSNASDNRAMSGGNYAREAKPDAANRWPANLILSDDPEVVGLFPITQTNAGTIAQGNAKGCFGVTGATGTIIQGDKGSAARFFKQVSPDAEDIATAQRLFYCAKASKRDRDEGLKGHVLHDVYSEATATPMRDQREQAKRANVHPTVKPTDLMRYLCRLVTPPGGVVLDPFMGSGSTGKAAMLEGFRFVGIEREAEYLAIARARIEAATMPEPKAEKPAAQTPKPKPVTNGQNDLFSEAD